ncbi:DUF6571 family protein [Streptomyces sp. NPDC006670]|uniref:DUF6571 family protein n=1 Tax=Streptomyces sp. NPDC006670 TaxID=3154476 RepID=UPI0033EB0919
MSERTAHRKMPGRALLIVGVCLTLLGSVGAWLLLGREKSAPCNGLAESQRVQKSVGTAVHSGMSCAALGDAIVKASVGIEPGRHTQAQAQAVKDVLFALGFGQPKDFTLDPALRAPLAAVLVDYTADVHTMLAGSDGKYVTEAGPSRDPWEADGTYHLAAFSEILKDTVRAVAQDPRAYATVRAAQTHYATQRLAAVPADATGYAFINPAMDNARVLGTLNGLTAGHSRDRAWRTTLRDHLLQAPPDPITVFWAQKLKGTSQAQLTDVLREQALDMTLAWSSTRTVEEPTRQGLLAQVETTELHAFQTIKP